MTFGTSICLLLGLSAGPAPSRPPAGAPQQGQRRGVVFDGKTAYRLPAKAVAFDAKAVTVAAWVRVGLVGRAQVFVCLGGIRNGFTLYLYKGKVRMLVGHAKGKYAYAAAPPPAPGTWTHYAGSYDGQSIRVYRNGRPAGRAQAAGRMRTAGTLILGALDETERFLTGRLDDVRIWARTLADEEIAAVASGKAAQALDGKLLAHWTQAGLKDDAWQAQPSSLPAAAKLKKGPIMINRKSDGYRGIWYYNQPSNDEYVYKYSGGLGTYCAKHIPHAWYAKEADKTFFCYGGRFKDKNQLVHMVSFFDHKTGTVARPTMLMDKKTDDAHDNCVLNVDDKGTIWIFHSSHGTARPSFISRSTKPYDTDEFECVWEGNFSYPQPWLLPGRGFLFLHTHYTKGRSLYQMTSADGVHWTERQLLARIDKGHYQISRPCGQRVGTAFNYHPHPGGLNWRTNLYYMETKDFGRTWTDVRAQKLTLPLTSPANAALVHDYGAEKLNVYLKDINYDADGHPVVLYVTSKGYESGPKNMPRTWTTARWTGSEWDIHGSIVSDNNYDTGSLYVEADGLWRIIGPTEVGPQPFNPGGEVAMWTSGDRGRTWKKVRRMTANSRYNHTYVRRPVYAHPDFYAFWADGHGRKPSDSRLYFCNKQGDVFRLPVRMTEDMQKPEKVRAE